MFYRSKKDGITFEEWEQSWKAIVERFQLFSGFINTPDLYRFNMSPMQSLKVIYHLEVDIKKNQKRIFKMQGFGKRLIEVMADQKISQLGLSQELDITQPQVHYYRKGHSTPRPIMRQKLATTLNVDYLWLSWGIGEKRYYSKENYPDEQMHLTLGERITYAMMIKNANVDTFSKKLGVTGSGLQHWMNGDRKPKISMLKKISKELHVDFNWLRAHKESTTTTKQIN